MKLLVVFLLSALIFVPLFQRLGLGSILGYLVAGIVVGPDVLQFVGSPSKIMHTAELGVIFLLFIIGLELQPSRLWILRKSIFGLGAAQVVLTSAMIAVLASAGFGLSAPASILVGLALAMSSTAFVLQTLAERNELTHRHGRDAFAILLFQDLAVIPILAVIPFLVSSSAAVGMATPSWWALPLLCAYILAARFGIRPFLAWIARLKSRELFTASALLTILGTGLLMHELHLSMALGAFLSGVILADSEFRHELEATIEPFKGLFLGLFFMSVGMSLKLEILVLEPEVIFMLVSGIFVVKIMALLFVGMIRGTPFEESKRLSLSLAQGGEFAFVLMTAAVAVGLFTQTQANYLNAAVSITLLLSPLLMALDRKVNKVTVSDLPQFDNVVDEGHPVIIAGFGRFGQIVARILTTRQFRFTALEKSMEQVDFVRRFGNKIYYGDAARFDLLKSSGVERAKLFVLAVDEMEASIRVAELMREHFPHVPVFARARNRAHAYRLMDLGVKYLVRETYLSSLDMAKAVLEELKIPSNEASLTVEGFRNYDEDLLLRQHAIYQDETKLIASGRQALEELENLFQSDVETKRPR